MSYATLDDCLVYFTTQRLNSQNWFTWPESERLIALNNGANLMDMLNFDGEKGNGEREFPRKGETEVPVAIKRANMEIAYALLDGRDVEMDAEQNGESAVIIGPGRRQFDTRTYNPAKANGIPSIVAWRLLLPYLRQNDTVIISRVD